MKSNNAKKKINKPGPIRKILNLFGGIFFVLVIFYIVFHKDISEAIERYKERKNLSATLMELKDGDNPDKLLQVHYIDVGQGDATLITYDGHSMLIDGGDNTKGTYIQKYLMDLDINSLDYVIGTHPDADHIGGLDVIIYKFDCEHIIMPNVSKDTKSYTDVICSIEEKGYTIEEPISGEEFYLGDVRCTILAPLSDKQYDDVNDSSIVIKMEYKDVSFIFAGDVGTLPMDDIIYSGVDLDCDVYKAAHHGSADSYNEDFLKSMSPHYMIISCGMDNDYNHPHKEITDYGEKHNITMYRTDINGNIVIYSDGEKIACIPQKAD